MSDDILDSVVGPSCDPECDSNKCNQDEITPQNIDEDICLQSSFNNNIYYSNSSNYGISHAQRFLSRPRMSVVGAIFYMMQLTVEQSQIQVSNEAEKIRDNQEELQELYDEQMLLNELGIQVETLAKKQIELAEKAAEAERNKSFWDHVNDSIQGVFDLAIDFVVTLFTNPTEAFGMLFSVHSIFSALMTGGDYVVANSFLGGYITEKESVIENLKNEDSKSSSDIVFWAPDYYSEYDENEADSTSSTGEESGRSYDYESDIRAFIDQGLLDGENEYDDLLSYIPGYSGYKTMIYQINSARLDYANTLLRAWGTEINADMDTLKAEYDFSGTKLQAILKRVSMMLDILQQIMEAYYQTMMENINRIAV